ncbi:MAG: choice-of-anchor D domain-containing protein [Myxococcota bacterium]
MWLLVACSSPEPADKPASEVPHPDLVVTPDLVDFGEVGVGEVVEATVEVRNAGDAPLDVEDLVQEGSGDFAASWSALATLGPGEGVPLTVAFAPSARGAASGSVLVSTGDGETLQTLLALLGTGLAADLTVSPSEIAFDGADWGCTGSVSVTLANEGDADLSIEEVSLVGTPASVTVPSPPSGTLAPGESVVFDVVHVAGDEEPAGALEVRSSEPGWPHVAPISGSAGRRDEVTDTWRQGGGPIDLVVSWDGSDSMDEDAPLQVAELRALVGLLLDTGVDFQLSVTVQDDGCVAGEPARAGMGVDAAIAALDAMLAAEDGSREEEGVARLLLALSDEARAGCNTGLVRDDATLALLGITDSVEMSEVSWSDALTTFQAVEADPDDLVVHAVAGDYPAGCATADAGRGWYELVVATGGLYASICGEAWSTELAGILAPAPDETFLLSAAPEPGTIRVTVDGVESTGWTESGGTIRFDVAPPGGAEIVAEYLAAADCE